MLRPDPPKWDLLRQECPTREVIARVGAKWSFLIIVSRATADGPTRYSDLLNSVEGIASKALASTLRALERDGLVSRTKKPTLPPTVEYSLTPLGDSLAEVLAHLQRWTYDNIADINEHQCFYDGLSS